MSEAACIANLEQQLAAATARAEAKTTVSEMADFPRPWRVEHSRRRHARGEYSRRIRAANDAYIAERVNYDGLAEHIVAAVNERDDLLAQLAAERARAEAAEAAIDAMDDYLNYRDQSIAENCRPRSFIEWWRIRQMAQKVQP